MLQGARRENILYGSSTDEQRRSSAKNRATRRAVFWRVAGGVAPQSESAAAIFLRRVLPAARQKTARPFLILIWALRQRNRQHIEALRGGTWNNRTSKNIAWYLNLARTVTK